MALNHPYSSLQPCIERQSRRKCSTAGFSFLGRNTKVPNRHSRVVICLAATAEAPVDRRSGDYHPTVWEDSYIQSLPTGSPGDSHLKRWEELKEEIRNLIGKQTCVVDQLELVDNLRQLGVSYHFEAEVKNLLSSFICSSKQTLQLIKNDLHANALLFRLFREYGFHNSQLSVEVLIGCIKSGDGSFKENLDNDVKGLLSLYESSFLALEGEGQLDEAREFAVKMLCYIKESSQHHNPKLVELIDYALELPLHWRMSRAHIRWFIDTCENNYQIDSFLLEFAKLDFNMVQSIYKQELKEMSRWWRNIGLVCAQLSFARDRLAKHYFWTIGFNYAPQFGACRIAVSKVNCIITLLDDIYDVYGTIDELELFTKSIEEWKTIDDKQLPNYMKTSLTALFDTMSDISNKVILEKGLNILPYLKHADELKRGDILKAVQCQMKNENVSEFIARDHIKDIIAKTWKELNGESITNLNYPESFKMAVIGIPRAAQSFYQFGDGHGKSRCEIRDKIMSIVVDPIVIG